MKLCDAVDEAVTHAEHSPDIAHHGLGRERAVGDDLRDPVAAVFVGDVFDDPIAAFHAEVDVGSRALTRVPD